MDLLKLQDLLGSKVGGDGGDGTAGVTNTGSGGGGVGGDTGGSSVDLELSSSVFNSDQI